MALKVLVIDDSAYARAELSALVTSIPGVDVVGTAVDGVDGFRQARRLDPDLIMLDLEMPNMDGFTFLRLLRSESRTPVIVVSGLSWAAHAPRAFKLGAMDFVEKPEHGPTKKILSLKDELVRKVEMIPALLEARRAASSPARGAMHTLGMPEAVVLGASTGGPGSVSEVVRRLSPDLGVYVAVSIHMPEWLTSAFIERLSTEASVPVRTAADGDVMRRGEVVVAPGGANLTFSREGGGREVRMRLAPKDPSDTYAPSVDKLFSSAAKVWKSTCVAVVMTGMGTDGSMGAVDIKKNGGYVIAESRESSLAPGMPDSAISTGTVDVVLSSTEIGEWLAHKCQHGVIKSYAPKAAG